MEKLASSGGVPVRTKPFPPYQTYDEREINAVTEVIKDGVISEFVGAGGPFFMGGKKVQELEGIYRKHCGVKHAISMNSATSNIIAAMGAFGIGPGDEVIVTPYSHVISATAPLLYDAIPVFADSEPDAFCMSVESIRKCISPRTKAIIVVDLFGQSADMDAIMHLADEHGLKVLSDSSHITWGTYKGKRSGTLAHIGCYSLNAHKTVQCGEGGIAVTNDDDLALKLQLIRNHAENCVADMNITDLTNMIGYNFRMTELEAAVAIEQIKKSKALVEHRVKMADYLTGRLAGMKGITPPLIRDNCTHDFLLYCIKYDAQEVGISRTEFLKHLAAEGIVTAKDSRWHVPPIFGGFVKPIHYQPVFSKKVFRPNGNPWTAEYYSGSVTYERGICPVVENLHENSLICITALYPPLTTGDMDDIADAIEKVINLSQ